MVAPRGPMEKEPTALEMFIQTLLNGIMGSLIIILIASGLCLIFGIMHIVNFAHGEFFMLGGFGAWLFFDQNLLSLPLPPTLRYIVAIVLSMLLVGTLGVVVERFIFRRFRDNLPRVIISSFGIMLILQAAALAGFGTTDKAFGSPFSGQINLGMVAISMERLAAIICGAIFIAGMYLFILRSKFGKAMRAVNVNYHLKDQCRIQTIIRHHTEFTLARWHPLVPSSSGLQRRPLKAIGFMLQ